MYKLAHVFHAYIMHILMYKTAGMLNGSIAHKAGNIRKKKILRSNTSLKCVTVSK